MDRAQCERALALYDALDDINGQIGRVKDGVIAEIIIRTPVGEVMKGLSVRYDLGAGASDRAKLVHNIALATLNAHRESVISQLGSLGIRVVSP